MARQLPGGRTTSDRASKDDVMGDSGEARSGSPEFARGSALEKLPADWLPIALLAGDAVIGAVSVPFAYWVRFGAASQALPFRTYLFATPVAMVIYVVALALNNQYRSWRGRTLAEQLLSLYSGMALAVILMLAAIEIGNLGTSFSRLTFVPAVLFAASLMTAERYFLRQRETRMRRRGIGTEKVLMVGTGPGSELLIRRTNMFPQYGFQVVGVVIDNRSSDDSYLGVPIVGKIDELPTLVQSLHVQQVFIALPASERGRLLTLVKMCEDSNLEFKIVPDLLEVMSTRVTSTAIDGLPLVGIQRSRLHGVGAAAKRTVDVVISAASLVIVSPVLLLVAVAIKLTMPGPILFRQERIGRHRRPFTILKLRSMIPDAEAKTGPTVARPGDDRVTWLGRFLRRSSIDELPQLYNVLRGDMSLVGPRPQPTFFDERYSGQVPRYLERQEVRPGLTGWAEVNDLRGAAPIEERTLYDVYYIEHWSLTLDLKIVLLTALRLFTQRHAY